MISIAHLDDLPSPLSRDRLYVFTCGPGGVVGSGAEALAIALPDSGWVTVDACKVGRKLPQEEIMKRWRRAPDEPLLAAVLTHPHDDHAGGLAELIDQLKPAAVAVTGNDPPEKNLAERIDDLLSTGVTSKDIAAKTVRAAVAAMQAHVASGNGKLVPIRDGQLLVNGRARIRCLAPTGSEIKTLLGGLPKERANELSAVLEVEWGETRLVLGADLPWKHSNQTVVMSGWASVDARHSGLDRHTALKVPHHGSREALFPQLLGTAGTEPRVWVCSPFEKCDLPRMEPGDGASQMLAVEHRLHLTKRPHVKDKQPKATLTMGELCPAAGSSRSFKTAPPDGALDAVWCFAFDDQAQLVGRWRGDAAIEVVP